MKVIAFNGSPRKGGNTQLLIEEVFKVLTVEGIETELFQLGGKIVQGCNACMSCRKTQDQRCHIKNDILNMAIGKMIEADAIILGSPVYFADVTAEMKALIDVAGYVTRGNGNLLARKVGAGIIAVRRAGAIHAFDTINNFFLINQMIVPGSTYWNIGIGRDKGDVLNDLEGIETMRNLGLNMAWLLKKLNP